MFVLYSFCVAELVNNAVIVSVVVGGASQEIQSVYGKVNKWSFVIDDKGIYNSYHVVGVSKIVVVNKEGNIIYSNSGLTTYNLLMSKINVEG